MGSNKREVCAQRKLLEEREDTQNAKRRISRADTLTHTSDAGKARARIRFPAQHLKCLNERNLHSKEGTKKETDKKQRQTAAKTV